MNMNLKHKNFRAIVPGYLNSIAVIDHDLSSALRIFKTNSKPIVKELNDRKSFKKQSVAKREQTNAAKFKQQKESQ